MSASPSAEAGGIDRARAHRRRQEFDEALTCYRAALERAPDDVALNAELGVFLLGLARAALPKTAAGIPDVSKLTTKHAAYPKLEESVRVHRRALKLQPSAERRRQLAEAINLVAVALQNEKRLRAALTAARDTVALAPQAAAGWSNLGNILKDLKFHRSAVQCQQRALRLQPDWPDFLYNLAVCLAAVPDSAGAIEALDRALAVKPHDPQLRWERALNHLRLSHFREGWIDYEARHETGALPPRNPPGALWRGEPYAGKRLLVISEQGFGDTIWAARYLARVKALGGELILEARRDVIPLLESMGVADRIIAKNEYLPEADLHSYICTLPGHFTLHTDAIYGAAYLEAPAARLEKALQLLRPAGDRFKIGIVWSGNPAFKQNSERSAPLKLFTDAFRHPDVQLFSLQKGPAATQLKEAGPVPVVDLGPHLADFADTAAVVSQLDLVIMTDSAVAHLAGALGKEVWVLLSPSPYWMWHEETADSAWYESMRFFRQRSWNDWVHAFDVAAAELMRVLDERKAG